MDTLIQASITYEIRTRVTQITATVTMVIAVWTFALWLIFGLQPNCDRRVDRCDGFDGRRLGFAGIRPPTVTVKRFSQKKIAQSHENGADPHVRSPPTVNG